jgi:hypothetical protein
MTATTKHDSSGDTTYQVIDMLKNAYRKLKSFVYFDKTQAVLKTKIIDFEHDKLKGDSYFKTIRDVLLASSNNEVLDNWINEVDCILLPKMGRSDPQSTPFIRSNVEPSESIEVKDYQAFIDIPVELHILAML